MAKSSGLHSRKSGEHSSCNSRQNTGGVPNRPVEKRVLALTRPRKKVWYINKKELNTNARKMVKSCNSLEPLPSQSVLEKLIGEEKPTELVTSDERMEPTKPPQIKPLLVTIKLSQITYYNSRSKKQCTKIRKRMAPSNNLLTHELAQINRWNVCRELLSEGASQAAGRSKRSTERKESSRSADLTKMYLQ